jgi:hypothetical protein
VGAANDRPRIPGLDIGLEDGAVLPLAGGEGDTAFAPKLKELFERACRIGRRRCRLDRLLGIAPNGREGEKLQRMIKRYRQNLFVFVTNRKLPPTNNGCEQALRPCVTLPKSDKRLALRVGRQALCRHPLACSKPHTLLRTPL